MPHAKTQAYPHWRTESVWSSFLLPGSGCGFSFSLSKLFVAKHNVLPHRFQLPCYPCFPRKPPLVRGEDLVCEILFDSSSTFKSVLLCFCFQAPFPWLSADSVHGTVGGGMAAGSKSAWIHEAGVPRVIFTLHSCSYVFSPAPFLMRCGLAFQLMMTSNSLSTCLSLLSAENGGLCHYSGIMSLSPQSIARSLA